MRQLLVRQAVGRAVGDASSMAWSSIRLQYETCLGHAANYVQAVRNFMIEINRGDTVKSDRHCQPAVLDKRRREDGTAGRLSCH
jgi:hypothetical protein